MSRIELEHVDDMFQSMNSNGINGLSCEQTCTYRHEANILYQNLVLVSYRNFICTKSVPNQIRDNLNQIVMLKGHLRLNKGLKGVIINFRFCENFTVKALLSNKGTNALINYRK